jgi:hypothetical protein
MLYRHPALSQTANKPAILLIIKYDLLAYIDLT